MANPMKIYSTIRTLVTLCILVLLSSRVYALGLGSLEVTSNLDQPLRAKIELLLNDGDSLDGVEVTMASSDEFERLGIDYFDYIEKIKLSLDVVDGNSVIIVRTDNAIKEPFIHFLVRVNWSNGRFLREYTALIDPPLYAAKNPQSVAEPKAVGNDVYYESEDVVYEAEDDDEVIYEPLTHDDSGYVASEVSGSSLIPTVSNANVNSKDDAQYGPVASGENLTLIALELQREFPDLSIYQIMPILLEENPEAFIDNNINGLLAGAVLNVSNVEEIRNYDIDEGKRFYYEQIRSWQPAYIDDSVKVSQDNYADSDDLYTDSDLGTSVTSTSQSDFQVGSSTNYDSALSSGDTDANEAEFIALKSELDQLEVSLQSSSIENQELKERISLLEGQLSDMNRLLSLDVDSAELANIENTLANSNNTIGEGELVSDVNLGADDVLELDVAEELIEIGDSELIDDELAQADEEQLNFTELDDTSIDLVQELEVGLDDVVAEETNIEPKKVILLPEKSFTDKINDVLFVNDGWRYLAGLGLTLLGFLGFAAYRKRRADEELEISMMTIDSQARQSDSIGGFEQEESEIPASLTDLDSRMSHQSVVNKIEDVSKESSFLTVYSDSDAVIQSDEVDPIAEADVYIAYGRSEQAEEVLINGLESNPNRDDIKHKLLSLYHTGGNVEAFERLAEGWYADEGVIEASVWSDVCTMGSELAPSNPLFSMPSTNVDIAGLEDSVVENSDVENIDDELSDEINEVITALDSEVEDSIVDFVDIESNIESVDIVTVENDNDLAITDDTIVDDVEMDAIVDNQINTDIEFDNSIELENFELEDIIDFDGGIESKADESMIDDVSDLEFEQDYDEAQTQYELAKVFSDLGDSDGAIKILTEIVANVENKEELKEKASQLLETLES